ncbi:ComEC/Rec2 family competence protein [Cerasicoccus fimbriatus]|uniref:ComEC/Rec2 family competence protein n=1 Tax=Cerasicoccus fimbriatus TaxID=3014554 RepID=UPI0022B395BE|nr:ComEC/Rec2 family competence protein [Cerasicoccus sp. TK19100]
MDTVGEPGKEPVQLKSGSHAPLLYLLIPLMLGYALGQHFPHVELSNAWLASTLAACIVATLAAFRSPRFAPLVLWGLAFAIAVTLASWRYYAYRIPTPPDLSQQPNREAEVDIKIDRVFAMRSQHLRIAGIGTLQDAPAHAPHLQGQMIYFQCWKDDPDAPVGRSAVIRVRGKLEPTPNDPDGFDGYLRQQGCHLKLTQASLREIVAPSPWLYQQFEHINEQWQAALLVGADSPRTKQLAGIATAMLLGEKTALSIEQKDRFIASGTMHLFAVSGLHVGIVAGLIALVLAGLCLPRKLRPVLGLLLLMGYVQVTGAAPSAIRAWWMAFFFWTAYGLMRKPQPLSALAGSALVVLLFDPRQLWSAGFQLSYTVVTGLIIYGAPLQDWLQQRFKPFRLIMPESQSRWQKLATWGVRGGFGLLAISFAASLYSAPLAIRYFGVLAPGSFLLNIPLVSLAPLAMTASLIAAVCGWVGLTPIAAFANHASWVFIAGMDVLVESFLKIPDGSLQLVWRWPGGGYTLAVLMVTAALLLADRRTPPWARFGVPPAMLLVGLVFGAELRHVAPI